MDEIALSAKRQLVAQLKKAMKDKRCSIAELARRMNTSRATVHRLLTPEDTAVTLTTLANIAVCLEITLRLKIGKEE